MPDGLPRLSFHRHEGPGRRWDRSRALGTCAVVLALLVVFTPAFLHGVDVWSHDEEFSFGYLVPPLAVGLLWLRRRDLLRSLGPGANIGLFPLCLGLLLLLASKRTGVHAIAGAAFLPTTIGLVAYLYGIAAARVVILPTTFLALSLSLYRGLLNSVGFPMQQITARASADLASVLGTPVRQSGVDLFTGKFHFVVAEACSGMSSLLSLICLGLLMVGLARATMARKVVLMVLILPIALLANTLRVTLVLVLSRPLGMDVVNSLLHGTMSAVLFIFAMILFVLAGSILGCLPRFDAAA